MGYFLSTAATFFVRRREIRLALLATSLCALTLGSTSLVSAQTSGVRITELQCNTDPEVVTITNQGGQPVDLAGWALKSDPVTTESFDLSVVGTLASGVSIFVEAGSQAAGSFVWSQQPVLRDSDATDFVRIVDAGGEAVDEVKCQGGSPTPSPGATTRPSAAPTAAPTTAPTDGVPIGGGPPGTDSWKATGLILMTGSWLLAAGLGAMVLARLRPHADQVPVGLTAGNGLPAGPTNGQAGTHGRWVYAALVIILAAIGGASAHSLRERKRSGRLRLKRGLDDFWDIE